MTAGRPETEPRPIEPPAIPPWWRRGDRGPTSAELREHVLEHADDELARQALAAMPAEQRAELERVSAIARAHHEDE